VIQNPGFLPDHPQNLTTCSLCHAQHTLKISERSVYNFLSHLVHTHTDKQTNKVWQKHYLLGGSNDAVCRRVCLVRLLLDFNPILGFVQ